MTNGIIPNNIIGANEITINLNLEILVLQYMK